MSLRNLTLPNSEVARNIEILSGSGNKISKFIVEEKPINFTALNLSYNRPADVLDIVIDLRELTNLDLSYNDINEVSPFSFYGAISFQQLILSHNRITTLHKNSFWGLPNLGRLDLGLNKISVILKL